MPKSDKMQVEIRLYEPQHRLPISLTSEILQTCRQTTLRSPTGGDENEGHIASV